MTCITHAENAKVKKFLLHAKLVGIMAAQKRKMANIWNHVTNLNGIEVSIFEKDNGRKTDWSV